MSPAPDKPPLSPLAALLAAPESAKLLQRRARELAQPPEPVAPQRLEPYVRFWLGRQEEYGVPYCIVDEVLMVEHVARVPCAPPAFSGVINRRGQMLPVLALARLFGLEPGPAPDAGIATGASKIGIVVVSAAGLTIGLHVDEPIDIDTYPLDTLGPPPPTHGKLPPAYVTGLLKRRITLLDMDRILSDLSPEERHE